jgi:hypothetical protein
MGSLRPKRRRRNPSQATKRRGSLNSNLSPASNRRAANLSNLAGSNSNNHRNETLSAIARSREGNQLPGARAGTKSRQRAGNPNGRPTRGAEAASQVQPKAVMDGATNVRPRNPDKENLNPGQQPLVHGESCASSLWAASARSVRT